MKRRSGQVPIAPCPCGRGASYEACCGRWHRAAEPEGPAPDAETLMRSRYSAYVLGLSDYLRATWHERTRPAELSLAETPPVHWLGLEVRAHHRDAEDHARVEFVARFKQGGRATRLHEVSRFVKEAGRWYYLDGDIG